jgi:hypothetical protein
MSADLTATAARYAQKHGVPFLYRNGKVLILVKGFHIDGSAILEHPKQMNTAAAAREFQRRAMRESQWKGNKQ